MRHLVDIDNKPDEPLFLGEDAQHVDTAHDGDGRSIMQGCDDRGSQCSHIDKEHRVIMQVCGGQEG